MQKLNSKSFSYAYDLVDYVNSHHISRDNIACIATNSYFVLFYWDE